MFNVQWRFSIVTEISTQSVLRVLGIFAQRDLIPKNIRVMRHKGKISLILDQDDLQERQALLIVEKIRAIIGIYSASVMPADDGHKKKDSSRRSLDQLSTPDS